MANSGKGLSTDACQNDDSFDVLIQDVQRTETEAKKLLKDIKNVLDGLIDLQKCEMKMVSNLERSPLCAVGKCSDDQLRHTVHSWSESLTERDKDCKKLTASTNSFCIDPLKEYLHLVSAHHSALRKRENALQEHAKALARWKKVEKEGKYSVTTIKLTELRNDLTEAEVAVDALNLAVQRDLTKVATISGGFLPTLLLLLARLQEAHYKTADKTLAAVSSDRRRQTLITDRSLQDEMASFLGELNALSIVEKL